MRPKNRDRKAAYLRFRTLLVDARNGLGLTQAELASRMGRPQSFVSKYESGERRLDVLEFLEVADLLKIQLPHFLTELQRKRSPNED